MGVAEAIADADTIELWPENVESFSIFMRLQTQWRTSAAGYTGMDYAGVAAFLRLARVKSTPQLFADIQAMETATLQALRG